MYVYIWKYPNGTPFYVGMAKNFRRPNPKSVGHRNKACIDAVQSIGADNVIIEIHTAPDIESAKNLERKFIALFGRLCNGTGTLTNIYTGGQFNEASEKTKKKLKEIWEDPEYRVKMVAARNGLKRNLAQSTKEILRVNLKNNPAMKGWSKRNGIDVEFDKKRIAGIQAAQPKRAEKMRDPVALAQRKERLKATLNSPEYKAKRALWDTPEYRQKLSDNKKQYWANKKGK
jgi:hypothetical protein